MRRAVAAAIAAIVVVLAACGPDAATFTVGNITVRDEVDLVTTASATSPPSGWDGTPAAFATDGLTRITVAWTGHTCVKAWTVTVSGFALVIDVEAGETDPDCGYGTITQPAVLLKLNRAVDASNIVVKLAEGTPS